MVLSEGGSARRVGVGVCVEGSGYRRRHVEGRDWVLALKVHGLLMFGKLPKIGGQ